MTHVIFVQDEDTCIHKYYPKSVDELYREIRMGTFQSPIALRDPAVVSLRNYLLIAEREAPVLISKNQLNILELLSMGASETEIGRTMQLSFSGVRKQIDSLKKKFDVTTREELIAIYCRRYR